MKLENNHTALHFDVLILGGGSAGSSAGLCLLKNGKLSVGMIEKGSYIESKIGESLGANVKPFLDYLSAWNSLDEAQLMHEFEYSSTWGGGNQSPFDQFNAMKQKSIGIDRALFDRQLAKLFAERGGRLMCQSQVIMCTKQIDNKWVVSIRDASSNIKKITCNYLIDASGRRGLMRTSSNLSLSVHDRLVGVGCVGQIPDGHKMILETQIEACEYGWWHVALLPENKVSVVLMSDPDIVNELKVSQFEIWHNLMNKMPLIGKVMNNVIFNEEPRSLPCFSSYLKQMGGSNWIAVGDAAASYDPICTNGATRAIDSGIHGAMVAIDVLLAKGSNHLLKAYSNAIQKEFSQYLKKQWQFYHRESRWANSLFWLRRRSVMEISGHALIKEVCFYEYQLDAQPIHLQGHELQMLWSLCQPGMSLHQVARDFSQMYSHVSEQKILLGLQELAQKESIRLSVYERETNNANALRPSLLLDSV